MVTPPQSLRYALPLTCFGPCNPQQNLLQMEWASLHGSGPDWVDQAPSRAMS